jgi:hypothetical protein
LKTTTAKEDYSVKRYTAAYYSLWNAFITTSKNATFLFHRDFMEYHADRFKDYSLLVFKKDKLIAVVPANRVDAHLHSHQGLSYGGVVLGKTLKMNAVLNVFVAVFAHLEAQDIQTVYFKPLPAIYSTVPSSELAYLMFVLKADLYRKDVLSVIHMADKIKISNNRLEGVRRAKKHGLVLETGDHFEVFWEQILIRNLKARFGVAPVHTLDEIKRLKEKFPNHIKLYTVYKGAEMVAGTVIFETDQVAHSQYISATEDRNVIGSLDFLHQHLITDIYKNKLYFDFGSSNTNNGKQINFGLQSWKEGFGARSITQDFYKVAVKNYKLLETVFI